MPKIDFSNKKVTVMGIGLHGGAVAMIKWLSGHGARVVATDMKSSAELAPSLEKLKGLKNVTIVTGQHRMEDFECVDMVIKNPGVPWSNKYIQAAVKKKVPVEMDSSLFFQLCSAKIIGVTGTKGKTTTSSLIYDILHTGGKKVVKVGIGQEAVMNKLADIDKDTLVVFELSSWRLSALKKHKMSPSVAVVTNIYQDHLNYYANMQEYVADKQAIFEFQKSADKVVLNWDNENETSWPVGAIESKGQRVYFSTEPIEQNMCVYVQSGQIQYNLDGRLGTVCQVKELRLRGQHNVGNVLAATAVGLLEGIPVENIKKAVTSYKGLAHRLELVSKIEGASFFNDTAATTPESAMAAIEAFNEDIFLIAGGSNKNLQLLELAKKIGCSEQVRKVFLLDGAATAELKKMIEQCGAQEKIVGVYDSMERAVQAAYQTYQEVPEAEVVVLLSPGCASFGMFKNEFDRGDQFKKAVEKLMFA